MKLNRRGFTLIELIIVIVIIGILASIAAPMAQGLKKKAIASEAIAALGAIWTAQQIYCSEHRQYCDSVSSLEVKGYLNPNDINGTYFSDYCYSAFSISVPPKYYAICLPKASQPAAPRYSEVQNWKSNQFLGDPNIYGDPYIAMDNNRKIYSNIDGLGYEASSDLAPFIVGSSP